MEKIMTFVLAIELSDEDLKNLGYVPKKVSSKDIRQLSVTMGELLRDKDLNPLMRRAAIKLGRKVKSGKEESTLGKKSKTQVPSRRSSQIGGPKRRLLHPLKVEDLKD